MELIELDATAQRALELLTNAGMSDGSIYDYTHTGFGSILRHFHTKGILYATAEMLDNFLLEQRVLLDQGDISQWKWGLVRRSCELLKQCAAMNSIDLPDLQPWDPVWNPNHPTRRTDGETVCRIGKYLCACLDGQQAYGTTWPFGKYGSPLHGRGISRHFEKAL